MQTNQDIKTDAEPDEQILKDIWPKISGQVLKPNVHKLGRIFYNGDVACVVFELLDQGNAAARALGWDGESPVFRMSNKRRNRFANALEQDFGDGAAARWLRQRRRGANFSHGSCGHGMPELRS